MRTTVTLDETRLARAIELTGIDSRTELLNAEPKATSAPRRRPA